VDARTNRPLNHRAVKVYLFRTALLNAFHGLLVASSLW
jgi:hypothetical protein